MEAYADNEDVVFESKEKLDYPCGDNLEDTDNRYLDRLSAKISHDWARKFNPRRTRIINERTYARQNVSDEFRETIRHNIGKKLIDYTRTISINPEEFGEKPVTELTPGEIRGKRAYVTSGCRVGFGPI